MVEFFITIPWARIKKVQVGNDREKGKSERNSHSEMKKKNKLAIRHLYLENIS